MKLQFLLVYHHTPTLTNVFFCSVLESFCPPALCLSSAVSRFCCRWAKRHDIFYTASSGISKLLLRKWRLTYLQKCFFLFYFGVGLSCQRTRINVAMRETLIKTIYLIGLTIFNSSIAVASNFFCLLRVEDGLSRSSRCQRGLIFDVCVESWDDTEATDSKLFDVVNRFCMCLKVKLWCSCGLFESRRAKRYMCISGPDINLMRNEVVGDIPNSFWYQIEFGQG